MKQLIDELGKLVRGIRVLAVPRIEDLPYHTSPPIQFVYESTATLALGLYVWADPPSPLTPNRPILDNALYYFRNITLTADTEVLDYTSNIVTSPQFFMYRESDLNTVLFREPVLMNTFYEQFAYPLVWESHRGADRLRAGFTGSLVQGPGLVGKASITLKAIITATEIVDKNFIEIFRSNYPTPPKNIKAVKYGK